MVVFAFFACKNSENHNNSKNSEIDFVESYSVENSTLIASVEITDAEKKEIIFNGGKIFLEIGNGLPVNRGTEIKIEPFSGLFYEVSSESAYATLDDLRQEFSRCFSKNIIDNFLNSGRYKEYNEKLYLNYFTDDYDKIDEWRDSFNWEKATIRDVKDDPETDCEYIYTVPTSESSVSYGAIFTTASRPSWNLGMA
jgi:hypothetical protein